MDGVRLNLARLADTGESLAAVKREFDGAHSNAHALADAVGHDRLAGALVDFSDKWDDRRADMAENIGALSESASGIAEAFGQLDSGYAAALGGGA